MYMYVYIYIYPPAPACQGPSGWEEQRWSHKSKVTSQEISSDLRSEVWGQPVLDLLVVGPPGAPIYLPAPRFPQLGVVLKINEISMHIQYTRKSQKWSPKTSQSHQNEVPRGTQSRQNNENSEKVKSNENINIYYTFKRLGHQNSQ